MVDSDETYYVIVSKGQRFTLYRGKKDNLQEMDTRQTKENFEGGKLILYYTLDGKQGDIGTAHHPCKSYWLKSRFDGKILELEGLEFATLAEA